MILIPPYKVLLCLMSFRITRIPKPTNQMCSKEEKCTFLHLEFPWKCIKFPKSTCWWDWSSLWVIASEYQITRSSELFSYVQGLEHQLQLIPHERTIIRGCSGLSNNKDKVFPPVRQTSKLTVQGRGSTLFWSRRRQPAGEYWDASPWGRYVRKHKTERDWCHESCSKWCHYHE